MDDDEYPDQPPGGEPLGQEPGAQTGGTEGAQPPPPPHMPPPVPPIPPSAPQPLGQEHVEQEVPTTAVGGAGQTGGSGESDTPGAAESARERHVETRIEIGIAAGDLRIVGGAAHVTVHLPDDEQSESYSPRDRDGVLSFARLPDDATLHVPDGVAMLVREVHGDLSVQAVDGQLEVSRVGREAALDGITAARLGSVRGRLRATNGGELELREVGGDAEVTDFARLALDGRVRSDLALREVERVELRGAVGSDLEIERCGVVTLDGSVGQDLTIFQCAGGVRVGSVGNDAELADVRAATIGSVGNDFKLRRCLEVVRVSRVGNDAEVAEVDTLTIGSVGEDLTVERVRGAVEVRHVGSDATLTRVGGRIAVSTVGSDLEVTGAPGGVSVEKVGGDADLDTELSPGAAYSVFAGGDVTLRVRGEVNARFVAQAGGEVSTQLPLTVERGRRRHLVGVLGRGEATVTLRSGGDIEIVAADRTARRASMSDEHEGQGQGPEDESTEWAQSNRGTGAGARTWEGSFGGKRFRLHWEQGPGRAGMHFQGPIDEDDPDAVGGQYNKAFGFEWERGRGARTYGEYEERLRDLGDKAERVARKAAEQAQGLAEEAARKTRETDWEAVGREVRGAISKAMTELEDAFSRVRSEWERQGGPGGTGGTGPSSRGGSTAQRVRIEQEEEQQGGAASQSTSTSQTNYSNQTTGAGGYGTSSNYSSSSTTYGGSTPETPQGGAPADREAQRRQILEQLRSGQIALDEAERRLNELR